MKAWVVVAAVGIATVCLKGVGPVVLGGRRLEGAAARVVGLLAPVMLVALVVATFRARPQAHPTQYVTS